MYLDTDLSRHYARLSKAAVPVYGLSRQGLKSALKKLPAPAAAWAKTCGFVARSGQTCLVPGDRGKLAAVLFGLGDGQGPTGAMTFGKLGRSLPKGSYRLANETGDDDLATLAWALGGYSFDRYRKRLHETPRLACKLSKDIRRQAQGVFLARDLVNTPASDMGPAALEAAMRQLAKTHKARMSAVRGDSLLNRNFPMVHAVGRASAQAPRVLDLKWGKASHTKVTLVGKGVTFDTGGLNIKPGGAMTLMKKDMGGAANVLGLAHMIMDAQLPVRLRVIVGAVENAISGNAFRPGDVLPSRKGMTVEIGNTDAEGRLVLGDCLALGDEEKPQIMIDMATLTGAARVALGPDLPPFYTHDEALAEAVSRSSQEVYDPLWRMPLWDPYQSMLSSRVADVNHISTGGFAGSVTAALFLSRFVEHADSWMHFDIFAWTPTERPWAPVGGEAQGIRALYRVLSDRFSR